MLPKIKHNLLVGFQKAQLLKLSVEGRGWSERWCQDQSRGKKLWELRKRFYSSSLKKEEDLGGGGSGGEEGWTPHLKCCKNQLKLAALQRRGKTHRSLHPRYSREARAPRWEAPAWCKLGYPRAQGTNHSPPKVLDNLRCQDLYDGLGCGRGTHCNIKVTTNLVGCGVRIHI